MSSTVVHVKNIAPQTSEKEVRDFFSFCGKITSLSITPSSSATDSPQSATVTFEKETAAKTALLLDNTQLGSSQVQVSSAANIKILPASYQQQTTQTVMRMTSPKKTSLAPASLLNISLAVIQSATTPSNAP